MVGDGGNPILICKKRELNDLFTPLFNLIFEAWNFYHMGMGLPGGVSWDKLDPILGRGILMLESHYQANFSTATAQLQYTEAQMRQGR